MSTSPCSAELLWPLTLLYRRYTQTFPVRKGLDRRKYHTKHHAQSHTIEQFFNLWVQDRDTSPQDRDTPPLEGAQGAFQQSYQLLRLDSLLSPSCAPSLTLSPSSHACTRAHTNSLSLSRSLSLSLSLSLSHTHRWRHICRNNRRHCLLLRFPDLVLSQEAHIVNSPKPTVLNPSSDLSGTDCQQS